MDEKFTATELIRKSADIENHLTDELSRKIYDIRLKYFFERNASTLREDILNLGLEWQIPAVDDMYRINNNIESIVIFSSGQDGRNTLMLLKNSKYKNEKILFCDNNPKLWNHEILGVRVISPQELLNNFKESIVVIGSSKYKVSILNQLLLKRYPRERILYPHNILIQGKIYNQYFDYFEPNESEIFIDGGCLNGQTALEFTKWATKGYKYIYSFEANSLAIKDCEDTFKKYNLNGEIISKGLWSKNDVLHFDLSLINDGSKIKSEGKETIEVTSIDETLNGKPATFVKMDIEGAEFKALLGAEKTIKKYRPRLAISIYHKPEDILELPTLLLEMQPDYKFALRQYAPNGHETILYAY